MQKSDNNYVVYFVRGGGPPLSLSLSLFVGAGHGCSQLYGNNSIFDSFSIKDYLYKITTADLLFGVILKESFVLSPRTAFFYWQRSVCSESLKRENSFQTSCFLLEINTCCCSILPCQLCAISVTMCMIPTASMI